LTLKDSVSLPKGYEKNDWISEHVEIFLDQAKKVFNMVTELCTETSCPEMVAGPNFTYLWADGVTVTKPISLPAKDYINSLFSWIQSQLQNDKLFPAKVSKSGYPKKFLPAVKNVYKRLFRVYAHIYRSHMEQISNQDDFLTSLKWFYYFISAFELVDTKEMEPLATLLHTFSQ